jgi:hypothetical protein
MRLVRTAVCRAVLAIAVLILLPGDGLAQLVPAPACYFGFVTDLRKAIGNADEADDFFLAIHAFSPTAIRGTADTLKYVGGDRFHNMFDVLENLRSQRRMPFSTDEELFEAIGKLGERVSQGSSVPGLTSIVGNLAGEAANAQGAAFSLFVAKRIAGNGSDYSKVSAFEVTFTAGSRGRRYDVVDSTGLRHENKSWTQGLPSAGSTDSLHFMEEFRADIILDGANGFNLTHYNFHSSVGADLTELHARLMEQFNAQEVIDALGSQVAQAAAAFDAAWKSGRLYSLYAF